MFPLLKKELSAGWKNCSPDTLLLLVTAANYHPVSFKKDYQKNMIWNFPLRSIILTLFISFKQWSDMSEWSPLDMSIITYRINLWWFSFQKIIDKSFLSDHWDCQTLFCEKTWTHLANVIMVKRTSIWFTLAMAEVYVLCSYSPLVKEIAYVILGFM